MMNSMKGKTIVLYARFGIIRDTLISTKMPCCPLQWNGHAALLNTYSKRKFDSALHPNRNYLCGFVLVPQYRKTKRII